jgi:hypothetical protein
MSLIHTCELNGRQPDRLSHRVAAARRGTATESGGVDAWNYHETLAAVDSG